MGLARIVGLALTARGVLKARRKYKEKQAEAQADTPAVAPAPADEPDRGRDANHPREIPKRGWRDVAHRVKRQIGQDNISLVSAGVAFYGLMALAPALAGLVSIYGLFASPGDIRDHFQNLIGVMPEQARQLLLDQVERIADNSDASLTLTAVGALALSLLSAMKGAKALITAANITYGEHERRNFFRLNLTALALTVAGTVFVIVALMVITAFPVVIDTLPLPEAARGVVQLIRWPIMAGLLILGLAAFYRYAPNRSDPKWRWVTWGSVLATGLWVIGSVLFSLYVARFGNYNETYGSLGAVVVLLMWFFVSAFVVLLGAEVNAEMEHQTARDSTTGPSAPLGERGAHVADTVGNARPASDHSSEGAVRD